MAHSTAGRGRKAQTQKKKEKQPKGGSAEHTEGKDEHTIAVIITMYIIPLMPVVSSILYAHRWWAVGGKLTAGLAVAPVEA
jgi:hypothetical protein